MNPDLDADVALVKAALEGRAEALARVDELVRAEAARQARLRHVDEAELAQAVRTRLTGPAGKLATWDAQGPLGAWLRVVTTRLALNLRRDAGKEEPVSSPVGPDAADGATSPELLVLRRQYGAHFKAAFADTVASLAPRDRTLLRLHVVDGVSLSKLGAMYQRDTSTLSRWVDAARSALAEGVRRRLAERLAVSGAELESIARAADFELSSGLSGWLHASTHE